jgi:hypothetical protein
MEENSETFVPITSKNLESRVLPLMSLKNSQKATHDMCKDIVADFPSSQVADREEKWSVEEGVALAASIGTYIGVSVLLPGWVLWKYVFRPRKSPLWAVD